MDQPSALALHEAYREASAALERAHDAPPLRFGQEVDLAARAVVRLRDEMIRRLRQDPQAPEAAGWRAALNDLNCALSLIVGVAYPTSGIRREPAEQALAILQALKL